jgi:hypothetical protein
MQRHSSIHEADKLYEMLAVLSKFSGRKNQLLEDFLTNLRVAIINAKNDDMIVVDAFPKKSENKV